MLFYLWKNLDYVKASCVSSKIENLMFKIQCFSTYPIKVTVNILQIGISCFLYSTKENSIYYGRKFVLLLVFNTNH